MEKLKELKLGKDLVGNKDAQTLAHDLLGKIIHCADGDYLITVTEAYSRQSRGNASCLYVFV
jgi:3-methyladenine DNA glycosylase Mpg